MAELKSIERRVISSEVGRRKPDEGFYRALLGSCGCRCDELLLVGDDPINDVGAARQVGIRAVQIDRGGGVSDEALRSLTDLLNLLPADP
jgi:FMN phosphatase YigB (HAD superfamily)